MQLPVNITYRGVAKSDDIDQLVMEKATRLEKFWEADRWAELVAFAAVACS